MAITAGFLTLGETAAVLRPEEAGALVDVGDDGDDGQGSPPALQIASSAGVNHSETQGWVSIFQDYVRKRTAKITGQPFIHPERAPSEEAVKNMSAILARLRVELTCRGDPNLRCGIWRLPAEDGIDTSE